jgi:DNA-binding transcriptional ArsR family regulator
MPANNTAEGVALPVSAELCNVPCFNVDLVQALRSRMPADEALEDVAALFGALADRTRLKLLHAFQDGAELCVCDVAHVLGVSMSAASHHLRRLRDLKILKYRNDGKMAYYSLRTPLAANLMTQALTVEKAQP